MVYRIEFRIQNVEPPNSGLHYGVDYRTLRGIYFFGDPPRGLGRGRMNRRILTWHIVHGTESMVYGV